MNPEIGVVHPILLKVLSRYMIGFMGSFGPSYKV